jgi:hypothetical protein
VTLEQVPVDSRRGAVVDDDVVVVMGLGRKRVEHAVAVLKVEVRDLVDAEASGVPRIVANSSGYCAYDS